MKIACKRTFYVSGALQVTQLIFNASAFAEYIPLLLKSP